MGWKSSQFQKNNPWKIKFLPTDDLEQRIFFVGIQSCADLQNVELQEIVTCTRSWGESSEKEAHPAESAHP